MCFIARAGGGPGCGDSLVRQRHPRLLYQQQPAQVQVSEQREGCPGAGDEGDSCSSSPSFITHEAFAVSARGTREVDSSISHQGCLMQTVLSFQLNTSYSNGSCCWNESCFMNCNSSPSQGRIAAHRSPVLRASICVCCADYHQHQASTTGLKHSPKQDNSPRDSSFPTAQLLEVSCLSYHDLIH